MKSTIIFIALLPLTLVVVAAKHGSPEENHFFPGCQALTPTGLNVDISDQKTVSGLGFLPSRNWLLVVRDHSRPGVWAYDGDTAKLQKKIPIECKDQEAVEYDSHR